jgi:hypothetical protein
MPEAPTTEPWAGTPPVPHALRPGAKPEAYFAKMSSVGGHVSRIFRRRNSS